MLRETLQRKALFACNKLFKNTSSDSSFFYYSLLVSTIFGKKNTIERRQDQRVQYTNGAYKAITPNLNTTMVTHVAFGNKNWMLEKYINGFLVPKKNMVVIDCGAFVGNFSRAIAPYVKKVIAVEPSPENFKCLLENTQHLDNIKTINCGLYNSDGTMPLNISSTGSDDSFLMPDTGFSEKKVNVDIFRYDQLFKDELPQNIILKIEAEGVEPEILEGIGLLRPKYIVVDCTPERDGQDVIKSMLSSKNYRITETDKTVRGFFEGP